MSKHKVGVDVGGTFTDLVSIDEDGLVRVAKTSSTPGDQSIGVVKAIEKAGVALDKALAINPQIPSALYYKGIYFEKIGNPEMAQKSFQDGYTNGKRYLQDNGEDYYLMFLISQKISKSEEGKNYKAEAERLFFSYEAPWKQK